MLKRKRKVLACQSAKSEHVKSQKTRLNMPTKNKHVRIQKLCSNMLL